MVKNPSAMQETWVQYLGWEDPLGKGTATHSSIFDKYIYKIFPSFSYLLDHYYPDSLVGKESTCNAGDLGSIHSINWPGFNPWAGKIPCRRERLPTPVFWPGEFHGLYSPWGHRVGHDWATFTFNKDYSIENSTQYSCNGLYEKTMSGYMYTCNWFTFLYTLN